MNTKPGECARESESLGAARSGDWSPELRSHLEGCAWCADAAMVAQALRQEMQAWEVPVLPSAGEVWWRAQIQARRLDAERAAQPVRLVQRIAAACSVMAMVFLLLLYAPHLQAWLKLLPAGAPEWGEPLGWVFLGITGTFIAAVSAGLGYIRHASK
jgi:hypothetical protein